MITIDLIDEMETKTEKPMNPKRRTIGKIWRGIWNQNQNSSHSEQKALSEIAELSRLDEISSGNWRVR